jgi:hypothetical protein
LVGLMGAPRQVESEEASEEARVEDREDVLLGARRWGGGLVLFFSQAFCLACGWRLKG